MVEPDRTESVFSVPSTDPAGEDTGCVILVAAGDDAGQRFELRAGEAVVGTREDCDLRLTDSTVSGRHLTIAVTPQGLLVTDLGSKNGTYYLQTRLEKAILQRGAALALGRTRLVLASREPAAGPGASQRDRYGGLVGRAPSMRRMYAVLEQLEPLDYTALILGETGVGKELVAREIHQHSTRAKGPFEVCDCAALTPTLVESELFGHVRGAFTGANNNYRGVFERAHGGTIFLDEIGELPAELQPKLLRVLESHSLRPVGSGENIQVDVRVLAATNRDLAAEVRAGRFRQDLFFRLNLVAVAIPALRDRREDIPQLIQHFQAELGLADFALSTSTVELFTTGYDWPGNVRELKHAIARVRAMGDLPEDLQPAAATHGVIEPSAPDPSATFQEAKRHIVDAFERDFLAAKLTQCNNNISQAARAAGLERNQLKRLLRKHGLLSSAEDG